MDKIHLISPDHLTLEAVRDILHGSYRLGLSEESRRRIRQCRAYLEDKLARTDEPLYGINTGFGFLCNILISREQTEELQYFLVQSHACGTGDEVPQDVVRLMMFLKIQSLAYGFSAVRLELVDGLVNLYNHDILPVIYQQGSLGASGDLAPLAHLSLPLIELGEVNFKGRRMPSAEALRELNISPLVLQAKEGLALLNGTQFSAAYGAWCLIEAERLFRTANLCAALSLDAFDCRLTPFDDRLHQIRPHQGQIRTAASIRELLADSSIAMREKHHVQDPYAFRCIPQVHGAGLDAILHVKQILVTEINSVTDNPNIFPVEDAIISGGNFHAQPLALGFDYLAIALAELGSISERRVFQLISGSRDLPAFLTPRPGLHSGLMIPQYTAASIVSQNKQLCTPASVDSIPSSNGQEDHVSMAANAATKLFKVVQNLERLLAIEFMTAAQALEFRRPARSSTLLEEMISRYRQIVPKLERDRVLSVDIQTTVEFLRNGEGV
jgi:histidine ammonia-lyase